MIFPQIRPDEPGTKPGDPGNGRVLVIDAKHQKFNGHKYHLKKGYYVCTINEKQYRLHADVWAYHNGSLPDGYIVHHDHRNPSFHEFTTVAVSDSRCGFAVVDVLQSS